MYIIIIIRIVWRAGQSGMKTQSPALACSRQHFRTALINEKGWVRRWFYFQQAFKRHPRRAGEGIDTYGWRVIYVDIPRFINNWYLVESLLPEDFHSLCTGNSWKQGQRGREAQFLNTDVPPPADGMENKPMQVFWREQNQSFMHSGPQHHRNDKRLQGRVRIQPESIKLQGSQVLFPISESHWSVRRVENQNPFPHFICFLWLQIVTGEHWPPQFHYLSLTQKILCSYSKTYLYLQSLQATINLGNIPFHLCRLAVLCTQELWFWKDSLHTSFFFNSRYNAFH